MIVTQFYPRNLDYIETDGGDFYVVIGEDHPVNRVFSYLKYVQSGPMINPSQEWHRNGKRYHRVLPNYHYSCIKKNINDYSDFTFNCPVNDVKITAIPFKDIKTYYKPEIRLQELMKAVKGESDELKIDSLLKETVELVDTLSKYSGVNITAFGVTGSILTGIHNPNFSDIDLTVYGRENSLSVRELLKDLRNKALSTIKPLHFDIVQEGIAKQSRLFKISRPQAKRILERRWNQAIFRKTRFSIHPVLPRTNSYGTMHYVNCGKVMVEGIVSSNEEGLFYPLSWNIDVIKSSNESVTIGEEIELVSFEGLYCDVFNIGDSIMIEGKLEKMIDPVEETLAGYRLVVGGSDETKITFNDLE